MPEPSLFLAALEKQLNARVKDRVDHKMKIMFGNVRADLLGEVLHGRLGEIKDAIREALTKEEYDIEIQSFIEGATSHTQKAVDEEVSALISTRKAKN